MSSRRSSTATHRTRVRAALRCVLVGASTVALAVSVSVGPAVRPAVAAPPITVAEAQTQVEQLETDAATLDEQAVGVRVKLTTGKRALATKEKDLRLQAAKLSRIRRQVTEVALAQYQNRNLDTTAQLLLSEDTDGFLKKMATVEKVSENQNTVLQDFQAQQARLTELERSAKVDVAALQSQDKELARLRTASAAKITASKAVLARLTKEERERIAAEERAAQRAAQRAADAAAAEAAAQAARDAAAARPTDTSPSSEPDTDTSSERDTGTSNDQKPSLRDSNESDRPSPGRSRKGQVAVDFAKRQLGKPYVWGAEGPRAYDCSGLMLAAWRSAGVSIPRVSIAQSTGAGRPVDRSDLQAGDLVFFYAPVSHVGMYVGNGVILHAPRPGKSVRYTKLSSMPYVGARRPA
ncbi:MAG TPA: NlpC/P60 family protein [Propionibacteriaceae bacterium]